MASLLKIVAPVESPVGEVDQQGTTTVPNVISMDPVGEGAEKIPAAQEDSLLDFEENTTIS